MKQYLTNLGTMFSEGNISIDTYDSSRYNFLTLDNDTFNQDINVSESTNVEAYSTLHGAYYKFVNILSGMSPIELYLDPTKILPTVLRDQDIQDTNLDDVMEAEKYQQLAAENELEMSAE